jgi:transposase
LGTGDNSPDHCVLLRFFDNPTESQLTVITQLVSGWTLRLWAGGTIRSILPDASKAAKGKRTTATGFEVIPRRWVVERTFAWLNRCRRLAKDWEKSIASAEAWIFIAHIRTLTRRIASLCNQT